ncbi:DNA alkylation repair protein [Leptospira sp. FAT2]|uniref:DNA alkylation repair protein n=1 Tax=Leptospira sanjuanensis TaxID=2879643 RepID=UPI001EE8CD8C|nr:DNA alkylation repair protein [Leptospira sanjuanensis]MCG6192551.1 DNA alkylation repair protein [Leptospira sanjuanensis]
MLLKRKNSISSATEVNRFTIFRKTDCETETDFLDRYADRMPRNMLRHAIEKLSEALKRNI